MKDLEARSDARCLLSRLDSRAPGRNGRPIAGCLGGAPRPAAFHSVDRRCLQLPVAQPGERLGPFLEGHSPVKAIGLDLLRPDLRLTLASTSSLSSERASAAQLPERRRCPPCFWKPSARATSARRRA